MKHVISPLDLSVSELDQVLSLAEKILDNPEQYTHVCDGKKLATLFTGVANFYIFRLYYII